MHIAPTTDAQHNCSSCNCCAEPATRSSFWVSLWQILQMLLDEYRLSVAKTLCLLQCSYDAKNLKKRKVSVDEYTVRGKEYCIAWDFLSLSVACLPSANLCLSCCRGWH